MRWGSSRSVWPFDGIRSNYASLLKSNVYKSTSYNNPTFPIPRPVQLTPQPPRVKGRATTKGRKGSGCAAMYVHSLSSSGSVVGRARESWKWKLRFMGVESDEGQDGGEG